MTGRNIVILLLLDDGPSFLAEFLMKLTTEFIRSSAMDTSGITTSESCTHKFSWWPRQYKYSAFEFSANSFACKSFFFPATFAAPSYPCPRIPEKGRLKASSEVFTSCKRVSAFVLLVVWKSRKTSSLSILALQKRIQNKPVYFC